VGARTARANKANGNAFEDLFLRQARRNGLLVIKHFLTARFTYRGRVQIIPGELDFKIANQQGRIGYFDCKTYHDSHFVYSALDSDQVKRAVTYNHYCIPSGFIVWFRQINQVVFYSGHAIARKGPGSRFEPSDGQSLGPFENFDLKPLLTS
jgi:hypothetical protein